MKSNITKSTLANRLLRYLERQAGKRINITELRSGFEPARRAVKTKGRKGRKHEPINKPTGETLDELLLELRELGMIESISRSIQATQPFLARGRISFSPSGLAFVAVRGARPAARDVFIGPRDVNGALPGDDVLVRLRDRTRDRFEGVVVDILERARNEYRMRILSAPDRGMAVGEILDVNARLPACVDVSRISADTRNQIKPDTVVIVHMSGDTVRYRGSFMKAAFFVRFESDTDLDPDFARILMKYKLSLG
ncbi:MAG: hypothetical protein KDK34_15095, partial [Leptospiraceae bacterium]|nr:hypothetical protein [Leptospiraceae bacterium]